MPLPNLTEAVVIDFETLPITDRPRHPPAPVGVSIQLGKKKPTYYAFAHPLGGNTHTWAQSRQALGAAYDSGRPLLFHNGLKFDLDVAEVHLGLARPDWTRVHDTLPALFLDDPRSPDFHLKSTAERLLGEKPDERDAVVNWLVEHQPVPGVRLSPKKGSDHYAGAYVAYAPPSVTGPYACGDTTRTLGVAQEIFKRIDARGMLRAYDLERELAYSLLDMERQGMRLDLARLQADIRRYEKTLLELEAWLRKRLKASEDVNLESGAQLAQALLSAGLVTEARLGQTATGKLQTNKEALAGALDDKQILGALKYRTQLGTCLKTFMRPWCLVAEESGGLIYTSWHSTRQDRGDDGVGTRTGRLSSTPNFQNIPKTFGEIFSKAVPPPIKLPPLPLVRGYVVPFEKEHKLIDRDYCFSPDTEVLTARGFVTFPKLLPQDLVAQWREGLISYAAPLAYQVKDVDGHLVHIIGERSADLLVTANHRCLVETAAGEPVFYEAADYPLGHFKQQHAGIAEGHNVVAEQLLQLVAAAQADASIKGTRVIWKLCKKRKIQRLRQLLKALDIDAQDRVTPSCRPGERVITIQVPRLLPLFLDLVSKTFDRRALLSLTPAVRSSFLRELSFWDGRRNGETAWSYFTTHPTNGEVVQELAVVTGLRTTRHKRKLPSKKVLDTVNMRMNSATWTQTFKKRQQRYCGKVYCVTMPWSTVIVRRNGKVCVTGQSQQELRILGHFEDGPLKEAYLKDPWLDLHEHARVLINGMLGTDFERKPIKNTGFGLIYGMGVGKLAEKNGTDVPTAKKIKEAYLRIFPGLKEIYQECARRAEAHEPIRTWGGREYFCEEPKFIEGRLRKFDYKLPNVLIQGSAADATKEAVKRFMKVKSPETRVYATVHDEILASTPKDLLHQEMKLLRECMESVEFSIPLLSEGDYGDSWTTLKTYDEKGKTNAH